MTEVPETKVNEQEVSAETNDTEKLPSKKAKVKARSVSKKLSTRAIVGYTVAGILIFNFSNIVVYHTTNFMISGDSFLPSLVQGLNKSLQLPNFIVPDYLFGLFEGRYDFLHFSIGLGISLLVIMSIISIIAYRSTGKRQERFGEEYGSAKKGDIKKDAYPLNALNNPDKDKAIDEANMILSKNIHIDMDTRHTKLGNDNVFIIGGPGSGKTRFFVKPNILQMYCNYVVIDPKGSVAEETGNAFVQNGYEVRYLNLVDMKKSMGYNPFEYFKKPEDVTSFVKNLITNTSDKNAGGDEFWKKSEQVWLTAIIFYIMATCEGTDKCNMNTVMLMLDHSQAKEEQEDFQSPVDVMFADLERQVRLKNKGRSTYSYADLAVKTYKIFKQGAGKTAKSILISIGVRLQDFTLEEVQTMMAKDELNLEHLGNPMVKSVAHPDDLGYDIDRHTYDTYKTNQGDIPYENLPQNRLRKMILFIIISDSNSTFSYLSSIILQQLYETLYRIADSRHDYHLPIHTRFINDEFATCGRQPDFQRKVNTMRSREISTAIIIQGISQVKIKEVYGDEWEAIYGGCCTTLFLGQTKEHSTIQEMKHLGGKSTYSHKTYSKTSGTSSSVTIGEQLVSRDQYDDSDLMGLPSNRCIVHIAGYDIFEDDKYDVVDHKNVRYTMDAPQGEKNRLVISEYRKIIEKFDKQRSKYRVKEIKDASNIDLNEIEGLRKGEIVESGDLSQYDNEYFIDSDFLSYVESEISDLGESDFMMELLPAS